MPELKSQYDEHFILHYPDGEPAKNLKYRITAEDGQVLKGIWRRWENYSFTKDAMTALNIEVFLLNKGLRKVNNEFIKALNPLLINNSFF